MARTRRVFGMLIVLVTTLFLGAHIVLGRTHAAAANLSFKSGIVSSRQPPSNPTSCGTWGVTPRWSVVPSPNANQFNGLLGVAAVNAQNIWTVGSSSNQGHTKQTLIQHWDGASWQIVASPNPSSTYNTLNGVAVLSATNIWAVGFAANPLDVGQTLIEHWNGAQWSVIPSPDSGADDNELYSVAAISASDIWAVGFTTGATVQTLIEHWNGAQWSVVASPNPSALSNVLSGVVAIATNDIWAVGNISVSSNVNQALIEHWNGSQWNVVNSPNPGAGDVLTSITALSANDMWAAGYTTTSSSTIQTLIEHWDGVHWSVVPSASFGTNFPMLFWAITALSDNDIWALGNSGGSSQFAVTLTEHWNGSQWRIVSSPSPGSFATQFDSVAAISPTDVWAVGIADNNTLIEHYHC